MKHMMIFWVTMGVVSATLDVKRLSPIAAIQQKLDDFIAQCESGIHPRVGISFGEVQLYCKTRHQEGNPTTETPAPEKEILQGKPVTDFVKKTDNLSTSKIMDALTSPKTDDYIIPAKFPAGYDEDVLPEREKPFSFS